MDARVHDNQEYYKNDMKSENLLTLRVISGVNGLEDRAYINFKQGSSPLYDGQYDAKKLSGLDIAPQLFTVTTGEEILSINTLPSVSGNEQVLLAFSCGLDGEYTLEISGQESFPLSTPLLLEDTQTGLHINLRETSTYTYNYVNGDDPLRFKVHFAEPAIVEEKSEDKGLIIYSERNLVNIYSAESEGIVHIYNLSGQLVAEQIIYNSITRIPVQGSNTYYLVRVITPMNMKTSRIFVR
jgi:hypothetical protein